MMKNGICGTIGSRTPITPRMKKKMASARFFALPREARRLLGGGCPVWAWSGFTGCPLAAGARGYREENSVESGPGPPDSALAAAAGRSQNLVHAPVDDRPERQGPDLRLDLRPVPDDDDD